MNLDVSIEFRTKDMNISLEQFSVSLVCGLLVNGPDNLFNFDLYKIFLFCIKKRGYHYLESC